MTLRKQLLTYSRCMRDHGVAEYPDPEFDAFGRPKFNPGLGGNLGDFRRGAAFHKALRACESQRPDFAEQFRRTPEEQAAEQSSLKRFSRCMRLHGIDVPDPTFDENGRPELDGLDAHGRTFAPPKDEALAQTTRDTCHRELSASQRRGQERVGPDAQLRRGSR